ncbi:fasciclin domain-containing protein [Maribacter halichondriae]|uniref:fasciclin domain-containing protein n=1 Tax=Maribacter halichondriae TaxID=2980554 RepID=UPI0023592CCE|nr:fasciclin domain-containing protein [Maribacter sp. Hal144]
MPVNVRACSKSDDPIENKSESGEENKPNIVELAQYVNQLSTLIDVLERSDASISEMLRAEGAMTVFVPTNNAFKAFLSQLEDFESIKDFDEVSEKQLLATILEYHIVTDAAYFSDNLSDAKVLTTLQTEELTINLVTDVLVQDKTEETAAVLNADNEASNGVVHIIDKILLPQEVLDELFPKPTIFEIIESQDDLSLFRDAIVKTGLHTILKEEAPLTVFAPTNQAIEVLFDVLGEEFTGLDDFDNSVYIEVLRQLLLYHIVPGNFASNDFEPGMLETLLTDESIEIIPSENTFIIGDASAFNANLLSVDQLASNGIIHSIDRILIPQSVIDFIRSAK